jgi:hypothetical protein
MEEINASLYPNQEPKQAKKGHRITENKIEAFIKANGVVKTADILGVPRGRISQLRGEKRLRQWVIAAGKKRKALGCNRSGGLKSGLQPKEGRLLR